MKTLRVGAGAMLERPLAAIPMTIEGLWFAALLLLDVLPANGALAPAAAVWPFDLYFDLKQSVAFSSSWPTFGVTVVALLVVRSALLGLTAALADGRNASIPRAFKNALFLCLGGVVVLLPVAGLFFVAVAIRYALFAWVAGGLGLVIGWRLCRRGVGLNTGVAARGGPVPEFPSFLMYAIALMGLGAALASLGAHSAALAALLVACAGPLHAMVWLGWRRRATEGVTSSEGRLVATLAFFLWLAFCVASGIDRNLRGYDVVPADYGGSLLLLGGVDSTAQTGALADLDPGALGYQRTQTELLSYADGTRYDASDTRGNLDRIAERVADQIAETHAEPLVLLGHSQASLILDRILDGDDQASLDRIAIISPNPSRPPSVDLPPPGEDGEGRVGGDLARAFAELMDLVNLSPYDVDAPASPTNVRSVDASGADTPRLALWALGDSVLLENDWRREGEVNLVVFSDHVGATRNPRALDSARLFLQGGNIAADDASWRSVLVNAFRYAFEPFRP